MIHSSGESDAIWVLLVLFKIMDHVTQITLSLKELIILKFQNFNIITNILDSGNLKKGQMHPTKHMLFSSTGALVIVYQLCLDTVCYSAAWVPL